MAWRPFVSTPRLPAPIKNPGRKRHLPCPGCRAAHSTGITHAPMVYNPRAAHTPATRPDHQRKRTIRAGSLCHCQPLSIITQSRISRPLSSCSCSAAAAASLPILLVVFAVEEGEDEGDAGGFGVAGGACG